MNEIDSDVFRLYADDSANSIYGSKCCVLCVAVSPHVGKLEINAL